jgi:hypothetical protein
MIFYRASHPDQDYIADVEYIDTVEAAVRSAEPGGCPVDEISAEPLPSGHTSWRWGMVRVRRDGTVSLDPDRWPA